MQKSMQTRNVFYSALVLFFALGNLSGALMPKQVRAELVPPVISAVQITGGEGKTAQDFIELFNPNPEPLNLNGYKIVKRSQFGATDVSVKSFSTDVFIPPYSFYLWANSTFVEISSLPNSTTSSTLADNNGIGLRFGSLDSGLLVESLAWGETTNGFTPTGLMNPSAAQSITRMDLFNSSVYQISNSTPRNSATQLSPHPAEDPVAEEAPVVVEEPAPETIEQPPIDSEEPVIEEPAEEDSTGTTEDLDDVPELVVEPENPVEEVSIKISEILPNPTGVDSGKESIELYNAGSSMAILDGWILDDVENYSSLSSNALILEEVSINPGGYLKIVIPKGKFTLNNSSGDVVALFDEAGNIQDLVSYLEKAEDGQSYTLINDEWFWAPSSLGEANPTDIDTSDTEEEDEVENLLDQEGLIISEIFPSPNKGQDEFVELFNSSNETINLSGAILRIGNKEVSLPNFLLSADDYYEISGKFLKVPLANSGKSIQLISNTGDVLDEVTYGKAPVGQSYALFNDRYEWTAKITPEAINILSEPSAKEVNHKTKDNNQTQKLATKKVQSKPSTAKKSTGLNSKKNVAKSESGKPSKNKTPELITQSQNQPNNFDFKGVIAIAVATLGAGGFAMYRFGV